jgi:hypothetical protein
LTNAELAEVTRNPWQLFKPDSRLAFLDSMTLEPRYGRPISDIDKGAWISNAGDGVLYDKLDEETADNSDFIAVNEGSIAKFGLNAIGEPGANHKLLWRMASSDGTKQARVSIRQGATTEICATTETISSTPTDYEYALSAGEVASITDYTTLQMWVEAL